MTGRRHGLARLDLMRPSNERADFIGVPHEIARAAPLEGPLISMDNQTWSARLRNPQSIARTRKDLDHVAVLYLVLPPDPLAVESRRRSPDPCADEGLGKVVVDPVGDVGDGRLRVERQRFRIGHAVRAEANADQAG